MPVSSSYYGTVDGKPVSLFTLSAGNGMVARITNYGATLTEFHAPDGNGQPADITLGFETLDGYLRGCPYFGATVGRHANRIAKGRFRLDGRLYTLAVNDGENHLHGGRKGFDKVVWDAEPARTGAALAMTYVSADGEEGYPGTLTAKLLFALDEHGEFRIEMSATADRPTIVNLAQHSYWNLSGRPQANILDHELMINADRYTPTDAQRIPTGEIAPVEATPYDFRTPKPIRRDLQRLPERVAGYDVNYVLGRELGRLRPVAKLSHPGSGRVLEVHTTAPGLQFYDGHLLDGSIRGKRGIVYGKFAGLCLETQRFPDGPNHAGFPPAELRPGQTYRHLMVHKFYTLSDHARPPSASTWADDV